jgi:hypothetical protein
MSRVANADASRHAPERGGAIHRVAASCSLSRLRGRVGEGASAFQPSEIVRDQPIKLLSLLDFLQDTP